MAFYSFKDHFDNIFDFNLFSYKYMYQFINESLGYLGAGSVKLVSRDVWGNMRSSEIYIFDSHDKVLTLPEDFRTSDIMKVLDAVSSYNNVQTEKKFIEKLSVSYLNIGVYINSNLDFFEDTKKTASYVSNKFIEYAVKLQNHSHTTDLLNFKVNHEYDFSYNELEEIYQMLFGHYYSDYGDTKEELDGNLENHQKLKLETEIKKNLHTLLKNQKGYSDKEIEKIRDYQPWVDEVHYSNHYHNFFESIQRFQSNLILKLLGNIFLKRFYNLDNELLVLNKNSEKISINDYLKIDLKVVELQKLRNEGNMDILSILEREYVAEIQEFLITYKKSAPVEVFPNHPHFEFFKHQFLFKLLLDKLDIKYCNAGTDLIGILYSDRTIEIRSILDRKHSIFLNDEMIVSKVKHGLFGADYHNEGLSYMLDEFNRSEESYLIEVRFNKELEFDFPYWKKISLNKNEYHLHYGVLNLYFDKNLSSDFTILFRKYISTSYVGSSVEKISFLINFFRKTNGIFFYYRLLPVENFHNLRGNSDTYKDILFNLNWLKKVKYTDSIAYLEMYDYLFYYYSHYKSPQEVKDLVLNFNHKSLNTSKTLLNLGEVNNKLGKYNEAIEFHKEFLKFHPDDRYSNWEVGLINLNNNLNLNESEIFFYKTLEILRNMQVKDERKNYLTYNIETSSIYFNLGLINYKNSKYQDSVIDFLKSLNYDPIHLSSIFYAAESYLKMYDTENSLKFYKKFLKIATKILDKSYSNTRKSNIEIIKENIDYVLQKVNYKKY